LLTFRTALLAGIVALSAPAFAGQGILVDKATFGVVNAQGSVIGGNCDATPNMSAACNGKEFCQVYVDSRYMCPDPARGMEKSVIVEWSCNGARQEKLSFPETAQALLRCPS
jgi:hypothetical protein